MKRVYLVLIPLLLMAACKGKDDNPVPSNLDFSTYMMYDINGNPVGMHGTGVDDDYQQEDWAPWVYNLFTGLDTADLAGTSVGNLQFGTFFPNPAINLQSYYFSSSSQVVLKLVLINKKGEILYSKSLKSTVGWQSFQITYNRTTIAAGDYRIYFSFSAEGNKFFYRAHTDIGLE